MDILIQYALAFIWMLLIPFLMGGVFIKVLSKNKEFVLVFAMATGLVTSYALYQIPAMILVWFDGSFRTLTKIFIASSLVIAVFGAWQWLVYFSGLYKSHKESSIGSTGGNHNYKINNADVKLYRDPYFWVGVILIIGQVAAILIMSTPDSDDAFYTGLSSMSLSYDYILKHDAYGGLMQSKISMRYVMAALPAYQASLSLMSKGLHTLIICHNLFPLFYIPLAYGLYCMVASKWLKRKEDLGKCLMFLAILHMYGNYFVFSPENFLITRIWQGKALFVTIGIPYVYYCICRAWDANHSKDSLCYFLMTAIGLCASAFMGETGLYLGIVLAGITALANLIVKKKYKNVIYTAICCLPQIVLFAAFYLGK